MDRILKVYKLKDNHWEINRLGNCFEKVNHIVNRHRKLNGDLELVGNKIPHRYYKKLHFHFYSFNTVSGHSTWKQFFPDFISQYHSFNIQTFSFILFIHNKSEIFALVGGHGTFAIKRFIDNNFGLDIVARTIRPTSDIVHLADLRGITGNIAGKTEAYREDQKILDIDSFGKVFKKLLFEIGKESLVNDFKLTEADFGRKTVFVKSDNAFTLRIGRDFDQFCDLIHNLIQIKKKAPKISLGTFSPILDQVQIEKSIKIRLFKIIQQRLQVDVIRRGELFFFDYDFCHPDKMLQFYECDLYQVYDRAAKEVIVETDNKNEVFELFLDYAKQSIDYTDLRNVMSLIGRSQVEGLKEGVPVTKAPLITHLSCEIGYPGGSVYKIDEHWYTVKDQFVAELNEQCKYYFDNFKAPDILPEIWVNPKDKEHSEDWYNSLYLGYGDFIVLDKVLSQNIELCDLLFETEEEVFCIHVKKGFNGMMRDLTNQVRIAARRLWIDLQTDEKLFVNGVYDSLVKKENWFHCGEPSREEFLSLFDKKIVFVIAFTSMTKRDRRVFSDIEYFQSNIAKYSITETMKQMRNQQYEVRILEIDHKYVD